LGRADVVQGLNRKRAEELLDGAIVGQVEHPGAADTRGGGRGGRPGVGDPDVRVDADLDQGLDAEPLRELARVHAEQN
jgi:hypothetical protein